MTRPFNIEKWIQKGNTTKVVDGQGNLVEIVYINRTPGEKPVLCVAHRPEGTASAWVTADGKLDEADDYPTLFMEEETAPAQKPGWRPAKPGTFCKGRLGDDGQMNVEEL